MRHNLISAFEVPYFEKQKETLQNLVVQNPVSAVKQFHSIGKLDYWNRAIELRQKDFHQKVTYRFHTSGTEFKNPTEQPWDQWTFQRSFCDASLMAHVLAKVQAREKILVGTAAFGALGISYQKVCDLLNVQCDFGSINFFDEVEFKRFLPDLFGKKYSCLIGAPGIIDQFIHISKRLGYYPKNFGIRSLISGIGTFLQVTQVYYFSEELGLEYIHEQGGKNEILHSVGATRFSKWQDRPVCREGYLHYLPWSAFIHTGDIKRFEEQKEIVSIKSGETGMLFMCRLTPDGVGCVSYINDYGDLGSVLGIGDLEVEKCSCGNTMPAFRFSGRVGNKIENKIGDTLFPEMFLFALNEIAKKCSIPSEIVSRIRVQGLLLRNPISSEADELWCFFGVESSFINGEYLDYEGFFKSISDNFFAAFPLFDRYKKAVHLMRFGGCVFIDRSLMIHLGRDKPQYPLVADATVQKSLSSIECIKKYCKDMFHAVVVHIEIYK